MKNFKYLFVGVLLLGCQVPSKLSGKRSPSSDNSLLLNNFEIEKVYSLEMQLETLKKSEKILLDTLQKERDGDGSKYAQDLHLLSKLQSNIKNLENEKLQLQDNISIGFEQTGESLPYSHSVNFTQDWRTQNEKLVISNPENYALNDGKIVREYAMNIADTTDYQLSVFHLPKINDPINNRYNATISCNAPFEIKQGLFFRKMAKEKIAKFELVEQKGKTPKITFRFNKLISQCEMRFHNIVHPEKQYGIRFLPESLETNRISELRNKVDVCFLPSDKNLKGIEKFFLTSDYQSMTCGMNVKSDDLTTLEDPLSGMKAKAESLLGMPVPEELITQKNPYLALDFSNAPKLDVVLISYLVFRSDFYGTLISRLLKWHADHGTQVRILVSDVITLAKDHQMLYGLQESSNNIKLQEFRYDSAGNGGGIGDLLSEFHRTMHVKLFVTLGKAEKDNVAFFGGRNIHDGFVFKDTPNYSAFPEMVQYGSEKGKDENFAPWRDFEVRVRSRTLAEKIANHYLTLWERDSQNFTMRSINQNIKINKYVDEQYFLNDDVTMIRHLLSIPYKDDAALENFYVKLFDSAEKTLRLSTPYFHLTKAIGDAVERAVARGVQVSVITRLDLKGDTADIIISEVNKGTINKFINKIKIYEYVVPNEILHSKLVLIDGKFSFIGSVNLNKRSFIHDMENGIMIYNKSYNQKMNKIMDSYMTTTKEVTEKQKLTLWKEIVVKIFDKDF
jgi:phosphatidylserine/phosphatidylglycerophosphate/cardiolipin synthase-like enzyme